MTTTETNQDAAARAKSARGLIFASKNKQRKSKLITFFDAELEIRQPTLRDIAAMNEDGSEQTALVRVIISYAYVPGTDIKMFSDHHADELMDLPFDDNFMAISEAVKEMTAGNVRDEKNA